MGGRDGGREKGERFYWFTQRLAQVYIFYGSGLSIMKAGASLWLVFFFKDTLLTSLTLSFHGNLLKTSGEYFWKRNTQQSVPLKSVGMATSTGLFNISRFQKVEA